MIEHMLCWYLEVPDQGGEAHSTEGRLWRERLLGKETSVGPTVNQVRGDFSSLVNIPHVTL